MDKETLGFVGVGKMGTPMVTRLLAQGRRVVIHDCDSAAAEAMVSFGAQRADSPAQLADLAPTVLLSLPASAAVESVVFGEQGLAKGKAVRHIVDFSTIGPTASVRIAAGLAARSITYVDAPVSGGVPGARGGTLAVMVSCRREVFESLGPLLQTFGKCFYLGQEPGLAQTMKLANNLLSAAAIAISSEAMVMGVKAGLDPKTMLDVINASSGRNSATQDKFPRSVLTGTFDYGFGTGLSYKDVRLCVDEAEHLGVPMIVGSAVREMLAITNALHGAQSDYTSVCLVVESWAGVQVRG